MNAPVPTQCDECGVTDLLPKHHVVITDPAAPPDALCAVSRHFYCCAGSGCPDGSCLGNPGLLIHPH